MRRFSCLRLWLRPSARLLVCSSGHCQLVCMKAGHWHSSSSHIDGHGGAAALAAAATAAEAILRPGESCSISCPNISSNLIELVLQTPLVTSAYVSFD